MAESYEAIVDLHSKLPPYSPLIPPGLLPYIAFFLLLSTFILGFYFTTLPQAPLPARELSIASLASLIAGFGVVSLFCSAGVNV